MAILEELNSEQKEAILTTEGPLLIIAGAGSGKTKTIAHRIAYLISKGVPPKKILAVTFTNKAAGEMKERIYQILAREHLLIERNHEPFVGTFHSLGVFMLRQHGSVIGIPRTFSILDEEDTRKIFKDLIEEFDLNPESYPPPRIRNGISRLKNELIDAAAYAEQHDERNPYERNLYRIYAAYEARLQKMNGVDFDDLLMKTVLMLERDPEVKEYYKNYWDYIHIDEYQDTNRAQYVLSRILASRHSNIAVVGDIDQAIYSWRGADWRNILQFELDWPNTKVITLEQNYRSTKLILEAANSVILNNRERKEKNLRSDKEVGDPISLMILNDEKQEAFFIAEYITTLKASGVAASSIAILFRTNAQSRAIEEAFLKKNIPYRLIAGVKFYERKEIKDVLAYIKFALNHEDYISERRILNTPPRGIGKVLALKYFGKQKLSMKEQEKITLFENIITTLQHSIETQKTSDLIKTLIRIAGFEAYYRGNKLEEDRKENVAELLSVAKKFDELPPREGIEKLLTEASLSTQDTEVENKEAEVILLTAHAAKGLEFDVVIIAGLEEGLFPHSLSQSPSEIEEERRLFYVALTRARRKVVITLTRKRMIFGEVSFNDPSRFLSEIPDHLLAGTDFGQQTKEHHYQDDTYEENEISFDS